MILRPGQCDVRQFTITSSIGQVLNMENGSIDFLQSIDIYESIFTPYIIADVNLVDGASFRERFNLSGDEDLTLEFAGYGFDEDPITYKLKLSEVKGLVTAPNLRSKFVSLRFVSPECLLNHSRSVAKSYNTSFENIVKDIYANYLDSKKPLTIEPTKDLPITVIPFLNPYTALSFLRKRSVSSSDPRSPLLNFENQKGNHFITIERILKNKGAGASDVFTFTQNEAVSSNIKGSDPTITDFGSPFLFHNFTVKTPADLPHLLDDGGLNSVVSEFDITTKQYRRRIFTNTPSNNSQLTDSVFKKYSQYIGKSYFLPYAKYKDTTNLTNNFIYDSLAEKISYSNIFAQQKIYIDIPGNTKIMAGSVVNLNVPRHDSLTGRTLNEMESGTFIVSSVKHSINNTQDAKYSSHLELMRYGRGVFEE